MAVDGWLLERGLYDLVTSWANAFTHSVRSGWQCAPCLDHSGGRLCDRRCRFHSDPG